MSTFIDRTPADSGKNVNNRNKFLRRIDAAYREGVRRMVNSSDISDLLSNKKKRVSIPGKGLDKPQFMFKTNSGVRKVVTTGNDQYKKGDKFKKPPNATGKGNPSGQEGRGEGGDDTGDSGDNDGSSFSFLISKDEYLDILFEELELPDMIKKQSDTVETTSLRRAGFATTGIPVRMSVVRSIKQAKGRKLAFEISFSNRIKELEEQLEELLAIDCRTEEQEYQILLIHDEIESLRRKIEAIPYLQESDLRYSRFEVQKVPVTKAVMFAIMDVSGSMGEWEREMAVRFFLLLALFIERQYEHMEIRWIVHTNVAWEVTSKEFFSCAASGGTYASSALTLVNKIIDEEYSSSNWNIFLSQISDGDNALSDTPETIRLLTEDLLPKVQYMAYAETRRGLNDIFLGHGISELHRHYKELETRFKNLKSSIISDVTKIYPIFRKLFEKNK